MRIAAQSLGEAAVNGGRGAARELLIHDVAHEMPEVRAFTSRQHRAGSNLLDDGGHADIGRRQFVLRLIEQSARESYARRPGHHIVAVNMMCALGVPGSMSHGEVFDGLVLSPVDSPVANGTYTTMLDVPPVMVLVATL